MIGITLIGEKLYDKLSFYRKHAILFICFTIYDNIDIGCEHHRNLSLFEIFGAQINSLNT